MNNANQYAKLGLPRLWPAVSGELYPETQRSIAGSLAEVRLLTNENPNCQEHDQIVSLLEKLDVLLGDHFASLSKLATDRLKSRPYGSESYTANNFSQPCAALEITAMEIKSTLQKIILLARTCFAKSEGTVYDKLALARLHEAEQDLHYLLFVEQQYLQPLLIH
jgi:hypothetical protein